jgi:hypothetical protein
MEVATIVGLSGGGVRVLIEIGTEETEPVTFVAVTTTEGYVVDGKRSVNVAVFTPVEVGVINDPLIEYV